MLHVHVCKMFCYYNIYTVYLIIIFINSTGHAPVRHWRAYAEGKPCMRCVRVHPKIKGSLKIKNAAKHFVL